MVSASPLRVQTTEGAGKSSTVMGALYWVHSGLLRSRVDQRAVVHRSHAGTTFERQQRDQRALETAWTCAP